MKRLLALLLSIVLVFTTTGCCCCTMPDLSDFTDILDLESDFDPTEFMSHPLPFTYSLTQEDVDQFYSLLEESEALALESTDFEAVDALTDSLDDQYSLLEDQCTIASCCIIVI